MKQKLASSGLTLNDAKLLGMTELPPQKLQRLVPHAPPVRALHIPYFSPTRAPTKAFRVRLLDAPPPGPFGEVTDMRYLQAKNSAPAAYFPRTVLWPQVFADKERPIIITEGELKAACACKHHFATIGLGGVSSWRSAKLGWSMIPDLLQVPWGSRSTIIVFDSDAATNPQVAAEVAKLSTALRHAGALVRVAVLPSIEPGKKCGVDDFIVARGADAFKAVLDAAPGDELTSALWDFNSQYVLLASPDILYDEKNDLQLRPRNAATSSLANVWATRHEGDKLKHVLVVKEWLAWPHRRELRQFTYAPGKPAVTGNEYNLWSGWGVQEKEGTIAPWLRLLDHLFRPEDCAARDWLIKWLAFPIQNPGTKMATAALLWGLGQGVGKSLFASTMRYIYGAKNYSAINQYEFESAFNAWGVNKQFVLVDDVSSVSRKEARDNAAVLKTRITQEFLTVNLKYVAQYTLPDTVNYFLTSNRPDALYLDEQDRRFFVYEATSKKLPLAMRDAYQRWRDGDGPAALLYYLRRVDLRGFDRFTEPPETESKQQMKHLTKTDAEVWCAKLRAAPDAVLRLGKVPLKADLYTSTALLALYSAATDTHNLSAQAMGAALTGAGFNRRLVNVGGVTRGLYAVRRPERWDALPPAKLAEHFTKFSSEVER